MAQNITIAGNQYPSVPSVLIPKTGGGGNAIFADPSVVTAVAADVASGKYFLDSSGVLTQGTASGGSSSWTKVTEKSYQINTTATTAQTIETWATGHSEIWTSNAFVYVRTRDTAGKRDGYFYGSDVFYSNPLPIDGSAQTSSTSYIFGITYSYNTSNLYSTRYIYTTTGYGVYVDSLASNGDIRVRARYNSSYSLTINGTYKMEVYLLNPPTGAPIFT